MARKEVHFQVNILILPGKIYGQFFQKIDHNYDSGDRASDFPKDSSSHLLKSMKRIIFAKQILNWSNNDEGKRKSQDYGD